MSGWLASSQWRIPLARQLLHSNKRWIHDSPVLGRRPGPKIISSRLPSRIVEPKIPELKTHEQLKTALARNLRRWALLPRTNGRFSALGVSDVKSRLLSFGKAIYGELQQPGPLDEELWNIDILTENAQESLDRATDVAFSARFLAWLVETLQETPEGEMLGAFRKAVDIRRFAWNFGEARAMKRTIVMHVGPTNSGKTYNALRRLVGARTGFYAAPLRLLAHEVYDRINRGLIQPFGKKVKPGLYPVPCNLTTGDDVQIVDENAGLLSCTTEMLQLTRLYDVGVIDEMQMIADKHRGISWTAAVLGARCRELHLCGEESAVPLVKNLLADTVDEIYVHKYERLTPLMVDTESLKSSWTNIRKGDCVIAFSRSRIFLLKQTIEKTTGLKCAVAYGQLPPEVRVEQARLFNDSNNDYDVMVASDAIGLGLNLKIKRIIFDTVTKFNGETDTQLSVSTIKQIGGRAGRYDPLSKKVEPGLVTTFHKGDLPVVLKAMSAPLLPTLQRATVSLTLDLATSVCQYIPDHSSLLAVQDILTSCAQVGKSYRFQEIGIRDELEDVSECLTLPEKLLMTYVPGGKHKLVMDVLRFYIEAYQRGDEVDFMDVLEKVQLLGYLDRAKNAIALAKNIEDGNVVASPSPTPTPMESKGTTSEVIPANGLDDGNDEISPSPPVATPSALKNITTVPSTEEGEYPSRRKKPRGLINESRSLLLPLELIHSSLSSYIWLAYRLMAFTKLKEAMQMKAETLQILQTLLDIVATDFNGVSSTNTGEGSGVSEPVTLPGVPYEYSREKVGVRATYTSISGLFDPEDSVQQAPEVF